MRKNLWVFLILFIAFLSFNNLEKNISGTIVNRYKQSLIEKNRKIEVLQKSYLHKTENITAKYIFDEFFWKILGRKK